VLYVLSFGPAVYAVNKADAGYEIAEAMYAPVLWFDDASTPAGRLLGAYLDWWMRLR
jgi:hypothetical protein